VIVEERETSKNARHGRPEPTPILRLRVFSVVPVFRVFHVFYVLRVFRNFRVFPVFSC
jgi:hypothetical protein